MRLVENPKTKVVTVMCDSWEEFVADLQTSVAHKASQYVYRGHSDSDWKLSSVFERWLERVAPNGPVDLATIDALVNGQITQFRALTADCFPSSSGAPMTSSCGR